MDNKKQKLLIEYLMSSADTFALCQGIVKSEYFDPEFRQSVTFIKKYYNEYNTTPSVSQVEAETGLALVHQDITKDQLEYTTTEIETFCRRKAIESAIISSPALIEKGDYAAIENNIRDAITISLHRNLGLRYFDDPEVRLRRMLADSPVMSTGWSDVDDLLFGGISKKELLLVSANSGGGKSITLANLSFNMLMDGRNVLYISLELSEDVVAQRFDTMFTGIGRKDWKSRVSEIATRVSSAKDSSGTLDIIQMKSGTNSNDIKAYLREYYLQYDMMPDLLVIDYLDKMRPNEQVDAGDVWTKDKLCAEQARDLGVEYNMAVATASQLNREAVKATSHDHSHIAGGISKINESDVYWSIIMTESMKAQGQMTFSFQKTRNSDGVGRTVHMKWNNKFLRIEDLNATGFAMKKNGQETLINNVDDIPTAGNSSPYSQLSDTFMPDL